MSSAVALKILERSCDQFGKFPPCFCPARYPNLEPEVCKDVACVQSGNRLRSLNEGRSLFRGTGLLESPKSGIRNPQQPERRVTGSAISNESLKPEPNPGGPSAHTVRFQARKGLGFWVLGLGTIQRIVWGTYSKLLFRHLLAP